MTDPSRCAATLNEMRCGNAGVLEEDGKRWCKQHLPSRVKRLHEERHERWERWQERAEKKRTRAALEKRAYAELALLSEAEAASVGLAELRSAILASDST